MRTTLPFFGHKLTDRQPMTKRQKILLGAAVFVALLGATPAVLADRTPAIAQSDASPTPSPLPVRTTSVHHVDRVRVERTYTGEIAARRSVESAFQRPGRIVRVLVDEGDRVRAGDLLAALDRDDLDRRREVLAARVSEARATLAELERGPRQETIRAQRAAVAELRARAASADAQARRRRSMIDEGAISADEVDVFEREAEAVAARRDAARARLDELEAGSRTEHVDAQRARVAALIAELAAIDVELSRTELRAPFDAVVAARHLDPGTVVDAGIPLVRLLDASGVEARVGVPPAVAEQLGADGAFELRIGGEARPGRLRAVLPEVDARTRTRMALLDLDSWAAPGRIARLTVVREEQDRGVWLPLTALSRSGSGLWDCYVAADTGTGTHVVERRRVEVVRTTAERALVRGALVDGDEVLVAGLQRVVPGQHIRPLASEDGE